MHRERETLIEERTARTNRIKSLLATQGVELEIRDDFPEQLEAARLWDGSPLPPDLKARLKREWRRRESAVEEFRAIEDEQERRLREVDGDSALEKVRRLMRIKGLGLQSAWLFVMEFFAWREFNNGKEVGALAGLAPTSYQSGETDHEQGVEKAGNRRVRTMAIEIAWGWIQHQPDSRIARWFEERFGDAGRRGRRRGIGAVARKLLVALWRYLEFGERPDGAVLNG